MCCTIHYRYRCGCNHKTVYQCPRIIEANQSLSPEYLLHGCSRSTTHLDEPCQECEGDPFGSLGQPPEADGNGEAPGDEFATPVGEEQASEADGEYFLPAEDDHDLENVDPNQVDDAEHGPASDGGLDVASNEPSVPERRGERRVLGEITLN